MAPLLLAVHVVAGILFVGPVTVAASLFPRFAGPPGDPHVVVARVLHRVTRTYGALALGVPLVGLLLAAVQGRLGEIWITVAMVLTAVAGGLLALRIAPGQGEALADPRPERLRRLRALTGAFNLLWVAVVVLMVVRPGAA
jgi:hypothetical protein